MTTQPRRHRIDKIKEIMATQLITSQLQLAECLKAEGIHVTQATLSRDLKTLNTIKVPSGRGTQIYVIPNSDALKDKLLVKGYIESEPNYSSGFVSLHFTGHIAVIKTRNGYASGMAYDIDQQGYEEILGTIPGSDTIFVALREDVTHDRALELLSKILPVSPHSQAIT